MQHPHLTKLERKGRESQPGWELRGPVPTLLLREAAPKSGPLFSI